MVRTIEQCINDFNEKISITKEKSLSQIHNLQIYLQRQIDDLTEKIVKKIEKYDKQIQENINFYHSLPEQSLLKGYFKNMLLSQLNEDLDLLEVEDSQLQQNQWVNQQMVNQQETSQQKQLKEVYQILKKAINLFSEQYSNSIQNLNNKIIDFNQKNVDYYSDYCLSQDRQHSNILLQRQKALDNSEGSLEIQEKEQNNIQIDVFSHIDLKNESPNHLPIQYHYSHVKCFSILDDNRRAVLCTRNNLLLIDILKSKVLKHTYLRGDQPTLPTCIQPLYSYEYENRNIFSEMFRSSSHAQNFYSIPQDFQNNLFTVNGNSPLVEDKNVQSNSENQNNKRQRKQNLIAVGMGSLSQTIDTCIYSLKTLQKIIRLPGHLRTICKIIQTPLDYETMFTISSDKKIIVWNLTNSNQIKVEDTNHDQSINDALMLNEYLLATFSLNGEIYLWDIEYTNQNPNKFKSLRKKTIIQRSCLSLYIGQVLTNSDRIYLSITSQGLNKQIYYLEMNDFQSRILVKQELPQKVIGLNVLSVNTDVYAFITYSSANFFEVYKIDTCQSAQKTATFIQRTDFPTYSFNISTVIESPRVQFIQLQKELNKILIAFALDQNITIYSISIN